ncbi:MAG TPA: HAMP domain-containing protein, partial [Thermoanaerobaculia bacterium]|nr:HAMP domain-containing protein [Thermoanaerobaculia bacterium]
MKIRTQLVLAFFLLAIVPLSGIVLYSYLASLSAVRGAVAEESRALTAEMDGRLASVRDGLDLRFANLSEVPFGALVGPEEGGLSDVEPLVEDLVLAMGDVAPLVESLEFVPAPARAPAPPRHSNPAGSPAAAAAVPGVPAAPRVPGFAHPGDPELGAVVIDVPRILAQARAAIPAGAAAVAGAHGGPDPEAALGLAPEVLGIVAESLAAEQERLALEIELAVEGAAPVPGERLAGLERALSEKAEARRRIAVGLHGAIEAKRRLSDERRQEIEARQKEQELLLGGEFQVPVTQDGEVVGHVKACVASKSVLREVLLASVRGEGEVPFAIDGEGNLHTVDEESRALLEELDLRRGGDGRWQPAGRRAGDWVVATSAKGASGLTFGIARPIRGSLAEVRRTAARNFGYGLGLIALGLVGIQPLSRRMTRQLETVTRGAERIAKGDLQTRLPVRSTSELGQLAEAFNRMAGELSVNQERLVREESRRKERELHERLLRAEYERKSLELEEARRFQLSLLPRELPEHPAFEVAVAMTTATEVGGDFYDFHLEDGVLTAAVGDATGHGARAGTMVTVIKSLFSAAAGASGPGRFLEDSNRAIKRMELGRMAMALALARFEPVAGPSGGPGRATYRMTVASAGMPPVLIHRRATGRVEEVVLAGMPLGGLDPSYTERELLLAPGDTVL